MRRPSLRRILILALVLWLAAGARAEAGFKEGVAAYKKGDYAAAFKEFRPLAEQGNASAQYNLGVMYANGLGVPKDDREAVKWFRKSTEQGYARAQYNLGVMYDEGRGVPQDDKEAAKWYRKAAERGLARAQNNLGVMYVKGRGVPQDYVFAHKWFNIAGANGAERAAAARDRIAEKMTPEQIEEATSRARAWMKRHGKNR